MLDQPARTIANIEGTQRVQINSGYRQKFPPDMARFVDAFRIFLSYKNRTLVLRRLMKVAS
jgi:hypothetical protein